MTDLIAEATDYVIEVDAFYVVAQVQQDECAIRFVFLESVAEVEELAVESDLTVS